MGRLMLNVLLSLAQFERQVTGERERSWSEPSQPPRGAFLDYKPAILAALQNGGMEDNRCHQVFTIAAE